MLKHSVLKHSVLKHSTKTQALTAHLLEMVSKMASESKLPTMQKLCDQTGVSAMTMHRALSELEAQGIVIRRQGSGTYVAPRLAQNEKPVALIYDRDVFEPGASPFGGLLIEAARRWAREHKRAWRFGLAIPSGGGVPVQDDLASALQDNAIGGIIFVGESNPGALKWLHRFKTPLVALSYTPITPFRVKIDHAEAVRLGVEALVAQGCRDLALWIPHGVGIGRTGRARSFPELDAFKQALKKHGMPFRPEQVWQLDQLSDQVPPRASESNQEQGLRAVREVFGARETAQNANRVAAARMSTHAAGATDSGAKSRNGVAHGAPVFPDGVVIDDDMMTRGALTTLGKLGLRVGRDIRIATHTNRGSTVLAGHEDELTLIEVDPAEIAEALFSLLETLGENQTPEQPVIEIKPHLVEAEIA